MLQKLAFWKLWGGAGANSASPPMQQKADIGFDDIYGREVEDAELIMYPPAHVGIPVFSLNAIKKRYRKQISDLIAHGGMGDHRHTEDGGLYRDALYSKVIDNFIEYAHMVPASEGYHHDKPGGLLVHCLEVATMAIRISKQERPSSNDDFIDIQRNKEKRMPYAAFLGGLLHDSGKLFTDVRVSALYVLPDNDNDSGSGNEIADVDVVKNSIAIPDWRPERESLLSWALRFGVTRYTVTYLPTRIHKRHNSQSAQLAPKVITPEGLDYLLADQLNLHEPLIDALNGYADSKDYLASIIRRADSKSAAQDAMRIHSAFTGMQNLSAFQKIHKLIRISYPSWSFNKKDAHAWCIGASVFLSWTRAFDAIIDTSRKTEIFIPRSAEFLYELMLENSIIKEFGGRDRTVKFSQGKYSKSRVENIHTGDEVPKWHHLIEIRDWNTLFDGDALPKSSPGLIHSPKTGDYLVIDARGETTVYKSEEIEADVHTRKEKEKALEVAADEKAKVKADAAEESKLSIKKAKETEKAKRETARVAKRQAEPTPDNTSAENSTKSESLANSSAQKNTVKAGAKKGIPKAKSRISPDMIAQMAAASSSEEAEKKNPNESTSTKGVTDENAKPNPKPNTAVKDSSKNDGEGSEVAEQSYAHLLPDGVTPQNSKHKGFMVIDAGALGAAMDMTAAEAVEDLIEKGIPFVDTPGEADQLIEINQSKKGVKLLAYIKEKDAGLLVSDGDTTTKQTTPKKSSGKDKANSTTSENSTRKAQKKDTGKTKATESSSANKNVPAENLKPQASSKPLDQTKGMHSTSSLGKQSAKPKSTEQTAPDEGALGIPDKGSSRKVDSKRKDEKSLERPRKALPATNSDATAILHHCQAAPRGSLAYYIEKLHEASPDFSFIYESDIKAVGFDREFTRALVKAGLATSLSSVGNVPYLIFEHFPDENAENSIYWYKAPIIYLHLSYLSEVQLGELK